MKVDSLSSAALPSGVLSGSSPPLGTEASPRVSLNGGGQDSARSDFRGSAIFPSPPASTSLPEIEAYLLKSIHWDQEGRQAYNRLSPQAKEGLYFLRVSGVSPNELLDFLKNSALVVLDASGKTGACVLLEQVRDLAGYGVRGLPHAFKNEGHAPFLNKLERVVYGSYGEYVEALRLARHYHVSQISLGARLDVNWGLMTDQQRAYLEGTIKPSFARAEWDIYLTQSTATVDIRLVSGRASKPRILEVKSGVKGFSPDGSEEGRLLMQAFRHGLLVRQHRLEGVEYAICAQKASRCWLDLISDVLNLMEVPYLIRLGDRNVVLSSRSLALSPVSEAPAIPFASLPPIPGTSARGKGKGLPPAAAPKMPAALGEHEMLYWIRVRSSVEDAIRYQVSAVREELDAAIELSSALTEVTESDRAMLSLADNNPDSSFFKSKDDKELSLRDLFKVMKASASRIAWSSVYQDLAALLRDYDAHRDRIFALETHIPEGEEGSHPEGSSPSIDPLPESAPSEPIVVEMPPVAARIEDAASATPLKPKEAPDFHDLQTLKDWSEMLERPGPDPIARLAGPSAYGPDGNLQPLYLEVVSLPSGKTGEVLLSPHPTRRFAGHHGVHIGYEVNPEGIYFPRHVGGRGALALGLAHLRRVAGVGDLHPVETSVLATHWGTRVQPLKGEKTAMRWDDLLAFCRNRRVAGLHDIFKLVGRVDPAFAGASRYVFITRKYEPEKNLFSATGLDIVPEGDPKCHDRNYLKVMLVEEEGEVRIERAWGKNVSEVVDALEGEEESLEGERADFAGSVEESGYRRLAPSRAFARNVSVR